MSAADRPDGRTERVTFLLRVRPERLDRYLAAHDAVWPEMRAALHRAGWSDYSLAVDRSTGLVVGTLVTDDFTTARERMAAEEVDARWQAAMRDHMAPVEPGDEPGAVRVLEQYFHNP